MEKRHTEWWPPLPLPPPLLLLHSRTGLAVRNSRPNRTNAEKRKDPLRPNPHNSGSSHRRLVAGVLLVDSQVRRGFPSGNGRTTLSFLHFGSFFSDLLSLLYVSRRLFQHHNTFRLLISDWCELDILGVCVCVSTAIHSDKKKQEKSAFRSLALTTITPVLARISVLCVCVCASECVCVCGTDSVKE